MKQANGVEFAEEYLQKDRKDRLRGKGKEEPSPCQHSKKNRGWEVLRTEEEV